MTKTIASKLVMLVGTLCAGLVLSLVVTWDRFGRTEAVMNDANDRFLQKAKVIAEVKVSIIKTSLEARQVMLYETDAERRAGLQRIGMLRQETRDRLGAFERLVESDAGRANFDKVTAAARAFDAAVDEIAPLLAEGRQREAFALLNQRAVPARNTLLAAVEDQITLTDASLGEGVEQAIGTVESAKALLAVMTGLLLVGAAAGGTMIARGISRDLGGEPGDVTAAAARIRDGDLATPVPVRPEDRGSALASFEQMRLALVRTIASVRDGVQSVGLASHEIAQGNADLSARTEQQASSLQQAAASMGQMNGSVKSNADAARQANEPAAGARDVATRSGAIVGEVVDTMGEISASSRRIGDIIGVIDGIAFQTNILALNAAVEAARAGEQGRGFAVVAAEVRTLAQRSAQAAREIKGLIGESVEKVEAGSRLVNDAGSTMGDLVAQVKRVTDLIGEISNASLEQSSGIGQVNQAVAQLDQMTQQNAALVEESAAASESLRQQAERLSQAVAAFRLA